MPSGITARLPRPACERTRSPAARSSRRSARGIASAKTPRAVASRAERRPRRKRRRAHARCRPAGASRRTEKTPQADDREAQPARADSRIVERDAPPDCGQSHHGKAAEPIKKNISNVTWAIARPCTKCVSASIHRPLRDRAREAFPAVASAIASACVLVSCGPRDAAYDPSSFRIHARSCRATSRFPGNPTARPSSTASTPKARVRFVLLGRPASDAAGPQARACEPARCGFTRTGSARVLPAGKSARLRFHGGGPPYRVQLRPGVQRRAGFPVPATLRNVTGLVPSTSRPQSISSLSRDTPPSHSLLALLHLRAGAGRRHAQPRSRLALSLLRMNRWMKHSHFAYRRRSCACRRNGGVRARPRAGQSDASGRAGATVYPPGIVAPAGYADALHEGIYASDAPKTCCFLAGSALLVLDNPAGAQLAVFTFYVPSVAPLQRNAERAHVSFNGRAAGAPALFVTRNAGRQLFHPAGAARASPFVRGAEHVGEMGTEKIGLNEDRRELSVMLVRIGYI